MLKSLQRLVEDLLPTAAAAQAPQAHEHHLRLATAALLMEMVHADFTVSPAERDHVQALLAQEFKLSPVEAAHIAEQGDQRGRAAVSLYEFTQALDATLPVADKLRVIEMLWQVAYADGALDKYEEHLMRKLADLLHLSHRQLIQAKHRVLEGRGVTR
ncbi:MAG: TerB family tellurite resistance protein [Gammaproteobacteria bacterium]